MLVEISADGFSPIATLPCGFRAGFGQSFVLVQSANTSNHEQRKGERGARFMRYETRNQVYA